MTAIASAAKIEIPFMTPSLALCGHSFNRVALAVNARGGSKRPAPDSKGISRDGKGTIPAPPVLAETGHSQIQNRPLRPSDADNLTTIQKPVAERADILMRGLAHVGINFETLLFGVAAPEAIKIARLVSRLVEIGLRQRHRRRTTWAGRSREVVPNLRYLLGCWHLMQLPAQAVAV
jgi:hypothetical protein